MRWETTTAEEKTNRLTDNRFTGCLWPHFDYAVVAEQTAAGWGMGSGGRVDRQSFCFLREEMKRNEAFTAVVKTRGGKDVFVGENQRSSHWEAGDGRRETGGGGGRRETVVGRWGVGGSGAPHEIRRWGRAPNNLLTITSCISITPRIEQNQNIAIIKAGHGNI